MGKGPSVLRNAIVNNVVSILTKIVNANYLVLLTDIKGLLVCGARRWYHDLKPLPRTISA